MQRERQQKHKKVRSCEHALLNTIVYTYTAHI
jgi:hypothetical protein